MTNSRDKKTKKLDSVKNLNTKTLISQNQKLRRVKPIEALKFLEEFRTLNENIDGPKKMISIRIPENLLRLLKTKAKVEDKKYQQLIIQSIRDYLQK